MRRLILIAAVAAALGGSTASAAPSTVPRGLVGVWIVGVGNSITFKSNGRVVLKAGIEVVTQSVSGTRTTVTFGRGGACKGPGTYKWKVVGRKVTFKPVRDACAIRRAILGGTWTRK